MRKADEIIFKTDSKHESKQEGTSTTCKVKQNQNEKRECQKQGKDKHKKQPD